MSETYEERLLIVAKGRCSAVMRSFGPRVKYLPSINGMICQLSQEEDDCFNSKREALNVAREFQAEARRRVAAEHGADDAFG